MSNLFILIMIISFGEFKFKSLLFLITPVFMALRGYLETKIKKENKNLFFNGFLRFFARSLNGILWIFFERAMAFRKRKEKEQKLVTKINNSLNDSVSDSKNNKKFINQFDLEKEKNSKKLIKEKKEKKKANLYILMFIAFLDFTSVTINMITSELKVQKHISLGLLTVFSCIRIYILAILSLVFQFTKSYSHHYFSAISIAIVGLIMLILSFFFEEDKNDDFFIKLILMIIPEILFSIMFTLGLIYLVKTDGNIYKILCINGITGLTLSILLQIIVSFFKCNNIKGFNEKFNFCDKDKNKFRTILYNFESFKNFNGIISVSVIIMNFF